MVTLGELLELDVFTRAEAKVVAGRNRLDRPVRWVHVFEADNVDQLISGGELLLSTGLAFGDSAPALSRITRKLAEANAAGLVIELGRFTSSVPYSCIQEAERVGLPIIVLRREAQFVRITEEVQTLIVNHRVEYLSRLDDLTVDFGDLLQRRASVGDILRRLGVFVGNPVVLEDLAHRVIAATDPVDERVDELLGSWDRHARSMHDDPDAVGSGRTRSWPGCLWCVVNLGNEQFGRLHLIELSKKSDDIDASSLDRAAGAIAILMLFNRIPSTVTDQARRSLISDVLQSKVKSRQEFLLRARNLDADLESRRLVALVVGPASLGHGGELGPNETQRELPSQVTAAAIRSATDSVGAVSLIAAEGERVLAVVGLMPGRIDHETLSQLSWSIQRAVDESLGAGSMFVGASNEAPAELLSRAFEQATEAFEYAARSRSDRPKLYSELGVHHLLLRLSEGSDLASFVESELGPLLEHDSQSSVPLLPTLTTYLTFGANKSVVARTMYIERRTLYHRIDRIEALLGRSLADHANAFRLELAINGLQVLRMRYPVDLSDKRWI